jgi:hypothetical protein
VWNIASSACVATITDPQRSVHSLLFAPQSPLLAATDRDGLVHVWTVLVECDRSVVTLVGSYSAPSSVGVLQHVAIAASGHHVSSFDGEGHVWLWEVQTTALLLEIDAGVLRADFPLPNVLVLHSGGTECGIYLLHRHTLLTTHARNTLFLGLDCILYALDPSDGRVVDIVDIFWLPFGLAESLKSRHADAAAVTSARAQKRSKETLGRLVCELASCAAAGSAYRSESLGLGAACFSFWDAWTGPPTDPPARAIRSYPLVVIASILNLSDLLGDLLEANPTAVEEGGMHAGQAWPISTPDGARVRVGLLTALQYSILLQHGDCVAKLLAAGANPDRRLDQTASGGESYSLAQLGWTPEQELSQALRVPTFASALLRVAHREMRQDMTWMEIEVAASELNRCRAARKALSSLQSLPVELDEELLSWALALAEPNDASIAEKDLLSIRLVFEELGTASAFSLGSPITKIGALMTRLSCKDKVDTQSLSTERGLLYTQCQMLRLLQRQLALHMRDTNTVRGAHPPPGECHCSTPAKQHFLCIQYIYNRYSTRLIASASLRRLHQQRYCNSLVAGLPRSKRLQRGRRGWRRRCANLGCKRSVRLRVWEMR